MSARALLLALVLCLLAFPGPAQSQQQGAVARPLIRPPSVTLTGPTNGQQFVVGQTVVMGAFGTPMNGDIRQMDIYLDGSVYATVYDHPDIAANWTATLGTHTVSALATDDALSRMSPTVTITVVANTPPSVSLTAPANGAIQTIGATVPMTATASDSDGTVSRVEFWVDGAKAGEATGSPYAYNWAATAGTHSVLAKAIDNANGATSTSAVTIHGVPPVPALTVPGTSNTGSYSASWTTSGGATHYELSEQVGAGGWTVIQDTSATSRSLSGKTDGGYSYRVRACSGAGTGNCSGYSTTKTITVSITSPPPPVPTLTVPATSTTGSYSTSWITSSGATHYELGEQVGAGSWSVIQDTSATSKNLSGKTNGSYGYRVRACAGAGTGNCSAYSATGTVTVAIPPPPVTLTRTYAYNSYQELCRVEEPETGTTLMGYDAVGNLAWSASGLPAGTACSSTGSGVDRKVTRTYDARNRVATLTFPDANGNQSWTYTPDGLPASVTTYNDAGASSVVNTYAYNKRRLLTGESQASGSNTWTVGYGYDANASLSTLVYPDSLTVGYAPNALGQPTQAGTYATNVTYYPNGAIAGFTYGNGVVHTLTQNARGLPDRSQDLNGSTAIHDDSYDYDPVGNVLAISDAVSGNRGNRDMVYDDVNRLTSATSPMFGTASYSYDALDNLTHVAVTGGSQVRDQDYIYDAHNRLTNLMAGGESVLGLGYDAQGNLANRNGTTHTFTFDYGNRLRTGEMESYRYDVQGRRIRSSSSAGVIYSLYAQSGQLLFQRDERASKRRQYVYLGGSLVAESAVPLAGGTATVTYQHTDALGTPVAITNSSKTVIERREYEPYGYQTTPALQDGPNYTGHVADAATGLINMQQRYYDPLIARFVSGDEITAYESPLINFNRYSYALNNPYLFTDPDGRDGCEFFGLCGPPEATKDPAMARADAIIGHDGRMIVGWWVASGAVGGGTAVLVETGAVSAAGQAVRSKVTAKLVCMVLSSCGVDPKDVKSPSDFKTSTEGQVVEDVRAADFLKRAMEKLRRAPTEIHPPKPPKPSTPPKPVQPIKPVPEPSKPTPEKPPIQ